MRGALFTLSRGKEKREANVRFIDVAQNTKSRRKENL